MSAIKHNCSVIFRPRAARGSVLLITLIVLGVITGVGIAGLAGTVLQERIARSLQSSTQVFALTAAALRRCEAHVRTGASEATGVASVTALTRFNRGLGADPGATSVAEYFQPLVAAGQPRFRVVCLIQFNGFVDAAQIGDSLRITSGGAVAYTIMASGARVSSAAAINPRPVIILESQMVVRR